MKSRRRSTLSVFASACCAILAVVSLPNRASSQLDEDDHRFQVTSSMFANNTTLPISAIYNFISNKFVARVEDTVYAKISDEQMVVLPCESGNQAREHFESLAKMIREK